MNELQNVFSLLSCADGESTAVTLPEWQSAVTYNSLRDQVAKMAEVLSGVGVRAGSRVATVFPNCLAAIVSFLAASMSGVAVPLNPGYRYTEFCFYLDDTAPCLLICPRNGAQEACRAAEERGIPVLFVDTNSKGIVKTTRSVRRTALLSESGPNEVALVLHTSGSTGRPKRVPIKQRNLLYACSNIADTYKLRGDDVSLCVMPLFHVHGLIGSVLSTFRSGGTICLPEKFNPTSFWATSAQHRVSWYSAVPTLHQLLLARMAGRKRPSEAKRLRFVRSCSAPLSEQLMNELEHALDVPVLQAYGMTEASHQICSNGLVAADRKVGSVGKSTGAEVSILGERGDHLPKGVVGEIVLRGPSLIERYDTEDDAVNTNAFTSGWFRTGDLGVLDNKGFLTLIGRIKELINRGGEKVGPLEIEDVLLAHPDVCEAAAFGIPDPTWGEEIAAAIVLRHSHSESELLDYCRQHLAAFKCPKTIHFVKNIPKTATGKIQRSAIAAAVRCGRISTFQ